jgi:hypothetical protein
MNNKVLRALTLAALFNIAASVKLEAKATTGV